MLSVHSVNQQEKASGSSVVKAVKWLRMMRCGSHDMVGMFIASEVCLGVLEKNPYL